LVPCTTAAAGPDYNGAGTSKLDGRGLADRSVSFGISERDDGQDRVPLRQREADRRVELPEARLSAAAAVRFGHGVLRARKSAARPEVPPKGNLAVLPAPASSS
jgi:hypothetical protein